MTNPNPVFRIDAAACAKGGAKAGAYLVAIGQTDMSKLNVEQWNRFCQIMVYSTFDGAVDAWASEIGSNSDTLSPPF